MIGGWVGKKSTGWIGAKIGRAMATEEKRYDLSDADKEFSPMVPVKNWNLEILSGLACVGDIVLYGT
jgi:hypothetical protein